MKREDFPSHSGHYIERDDVSILEKADRYLAANYDATRSQPWAGPGPGMYFATYSSIGGREFKVKCWWEEGPKSHMEIVEVHERVHL